MPVKVGLRYIEIWKDDLEPVVCRYVDRVPHGLVEALAAYAADPSDDNWAAIGDILTQ